MRKFTVKIRSVGTIILHGETLQDVVKLSLVTLTPEQVDCIADLAIGQYDRFSVVTFM